jgi:hypothetical protein
LGDERLPVSTRIPGQAHVPVRPSHSGPLGSGQW